MAVFPRVIRAARLHRAIIAAINRGIEHRRASDNAESMYQSHRIWQSNGSAAHLARFVEPPGGAGSIAALPLRKQFPPVPPACFCNQLTANPVIAKSDKQRLLPT